MPPSLEVDILEGPRGWTAEVTVTERGEATHHFVHISRDEYQRLTGGAHTPEALVRASFEFLLERERKESILREFEISVISQYFPEYESVVGDRLRQTQGGGE